MTRRAVERRVADIVRWMERFEKSYRSGAIESALMDAECARADLDDLRSDVWSSVGSKAVGGRSRCRIFAAAVSIAAASVVFTALPASQPRGDEHFEQLYASERAEHSRGDDRIEVKADAAAERAQLRDDSVTVSQAAPPETAQRIAPADNKKAELPRGSQPGRKALKRGGGAKAAAQKGAADASQSVKRAERLDADSLPYDKMLSLIQTGSKALRNDEPVISVNRTKGEKNI